jgi:hypothetical protein
MYDWKAEQIYFYKNEEVCVEDIKVVKRIPYSTKCFEVFYSNDTSCYISYLMIRNALKINYNIHHAFKA